MNKTIIGAVIAIVVIAGAGYWFTHKQSGGAMMTQSPAVPGGMMSMKDLVASGVSQKCDFSEPESGTGGTVYIAGGKVRADFTSKSQAGTIGGHMISDGTVVNTWMDGMTQGFKSSFTMTQTASSTAAPHKGLDPNKKTNYTCTPWSADASMFALPSGITFTDMSAMMQGGAAGAGANAGASAGPVGTRNQCAMCDKAPEPQRSQCKTALRCQ